MTSQQALDYLHTFNYEEFIARDFPSHRFGQISSSIAESNNIWLADVRQESTLQLLDSIWHMVAEQRQERRAKAENRCNLHGMSGFTDWATKLLLDNITFAGRCNVVLTSNKEEFVEARVLNPQSTNSTFAPDARRMFVVSFAPKGSSLSHRPDCCSCRRWQDLRFPCAHTCAVMRAAKIDIKSKIEDRMG